MKKSFSARITENVLTTAKKDAKNKGFDNFSKYVEQALIHEINYGNDTQAVYELQEIRNTIDKRLEILNSSTVKNELEVKPLEYYIEEVNNIYNANGYIVIGVINRFAKKCGMSSDEFRQVLFDNGFCGVINE